MIRFFGVVPVVALFLGGALAGDAERATTVVRDVGTIPEADRDTRLVQELCALLRANPDDVIVAVEVRVEGPSKSYVRVLYDRKQRLLLVLARTAHPKRDFYHVSLYPDTDPADFKKGFPVRAQKGYPKVSQSFNKDDVVIPVVYAEFPRLSNWP
jgi:hypothetical protein